MPDEPLLGKRALIMGATGDVAEAVAVALAAAGADVALTTATNDAEEAFGLRRISRKVTNLGRRSMNESVDMSLGTNVQIAMRQVAKELGGLDILVLAPALRVDKPVERLTDADWARLAGVNLSGVFYACRSAYREMQNNESPGGHVVLLVEEPTASDGAGYVALKAAARTLLGELSREWTGRGMTLTALEPAGDAAATATNLLKEIGARPKP